MKIPADWKSEKLGKVSQITMGQSPDSKYYTTEDNHLPFLQGCADFQQRFPAPVLSCTQVTKLAERGSILLSVRAPVGDMNIADRDYIIGRGLAAIKGTTIDHDYLEEYLSFSSQHLQNASQGSTFQAINSKQLADIDISFPTNDIEQKAIATILSAADQARTTLEIVAAKQRRIKNGLLQTLLANGISSSGAIRSEETHEYQDTIVGRIPKEWALKPLSSLVDEPITYGIVQAGPHIENGVPYIRTGDMAGDAIETQTLLRTSRKIADSYKRSEVKTGDIVFALRASVGKVLPVTDSVAGANLTQGTAKISPKSTVNSGYLLWALRTSGVKQQIRIAEKGTTFAEITLSDLRQINVPLPNSPDEQEEIVQTLSKAETVVSCYQVHLAKLRRLKMGLMQDLLTGRKRVTALLEPEQRREKLYA